MVYFQDASNRNLMVYLPDSLSPTRHEAELAARLNIAVAPRPVQPPMAELFNSRRRVVWQQDPCLLDDDD